MGGVHLGSLGGGGDTPVAWTADQQVFWRLRAGQPDDRVLQVKVGEGAFENGWALTGAPTESRLNPHARDCDGT